MKIKFEKKAIKIYKKIYDESIDEFRLACKRIAIVYLRKQGLAERPTQQTDADRGTKVTDLDRPTKVTDIGRPTKMTEIERGTKVTSKVTEK